MAVTFHEVQFPPDISYGVTGGPAYSTSIVTTSSGWEQRNMNWEEGRCEYQADQGVKTEEQMHRLIAFFRARRGKAYGFRYKDWADYKAIGQLIGTGDGSTNIFQLQKTYMDDAGYTEVRTINKPVAGSISIYIAGVKQTSGFSVDITTGQVVIATAPASGAITADFEFDVPCRFDTDKMPASIVEFNNYNWTGIPIVEVRV